MTTTERKPLPPVICHPWCLAKTGHDDEVFLEDQYCYGEELTTNLCLQPPFDAGYTDYATVYATTMHGPGPVVVALVHGEGPGIRMTPFEARKLIDNLLRVLGQIEAAR